MPDKMKESRNNASEMTSFDRLIESIRVNYQNNGDYMTPLFDLSVACAYSVCNKLQFVGYTDKIRLLKQSIASGLQMLSDSVSDEKKISDIIGDGMDLVYAAYTTGLELCELHNGDLKSQYIQSRVSHKVWYTDPDVCKPTETETSGIREMYRAARRYIQDNRAVSVDATNIYRYIEYQYSEISDSDELSDFSEDFVVYRRLNGVYNGNDDTPLTDAVTSDRGDMETVDIMIDRMRLTDKERKVLEYRVRGYGEKAIAKAIGVSRDSVHGCIRRIRQKALKCDFKNYRT